MNSGRWAAGLALSAAALAGCGSGADRVACDKPFDQAGWERKTSTDPNVDGRSRRAILVDQLIHCEVLFGLRDARVSQLIGDPDRTSRTVEGARLWIYLVGPGSLGLRDEQLVVRFEKRRVDEVYRTY